MEPTVDETLDPEMTAIVEAALPMIPPALAGYPFAWRGPLVVVLACCREHLARLEPAAAAAPPGPTLAVLPLPVAMTRIREARGNIPPGVPHPADHLAQVAADAGPEDLLLVVLNRGDLAVVVVAGPDEEGGLNAPGGRA